MAFSDNFLAANLNKFPAEEIPSLRQRLDSLAPAQQNVVYASNFKDPTTALIISIFLGHLGIDRFYIGDIGLGVAKLFLNWLTFGIWCIVDWFLIMGATKKNNAKLLNEALDAAGAQTPAQAQVAVVDGPIVKPTTVVEPVVVEEEVIETPAPIIEQVESLASDVKEEAQEAVSTVEEKVEPVLAEVQEEVVSNLSEAKEEAEEVVSEVTEKTEEVVSEVADKTENLVSEAKTEVKDFEPIQPVQLEDE